jgi:hypothetical protein
MESQLTKSSPSFASLKWRGSILLFFVELLETVLVALSPIAWIAHLRRKVLPMWLVDLWVAALCAASVFLVFWFTTFDESWRVIAKWAAVYLLLESLGVLLRDLVLSPLIYKDECGPLVGVREPRRWVMMAPIGLIPVILAFAILYLFHGCDFGPSPILEPLQAVYFSMVTFTTLGYGDYHPVTDVGRILVVAELGFFILFLAIKLPIAVSVLRVKGTTGRAA